MKISQFEGRRVALWGWGREGHAAYAAIRAQLPKLALTLFCPAAEVETARALGDDLLTVRSDVSGQALSAFDVVIKSPGISPYKPEALEAAAAGTQFIGGSSLWFAAHADVDGRLVNTVCVTGTKGKSTTTSLVAHLLRAGGHRTGLAGNIGLPLLEVLDPQPAPDYWAVELSSYQTGEVARAGVRPDVAIVLNIFPEHLDWHGSEQRYIDDKLSLVTAGHPRIAVLNAADPHLQALDLPHSRIVWFNQPAGWHMRGSVVYRGDLAVCDTASSPLPGAHNRSNLCAVLAAIEALGLDAVALAPAVDTFRPLPNRLQMLGTVDGVTWVNDSISTTPHASLAALDCFAGHRVALLVGGHDRGLEWQSFSDAMAVHAPAAIITMGANGPRIHDVLQPVSARCGFRLEAADGLVQAVEMARGSLGEAGGVVLLSPGAPSFGAYPDYVARGKHFAALAGFDPAAIARIPGLGVA